MAASDSAEERAAWQTAIVEAMEAGVLAYKKGAHEGFLPRPGTEAERLTATAIADPGWPGAHWTRDAAAPLHQVCLIIANAAVGHLRDLELLVRDDLDRQSIPLVARGVVENCARLFQILVGPFLGGDVGVNQVRQCFAIAYRDVIESAMRECELQERAFKRGATTEQNVESARSELGRVKQAFGQLFSSDSTDVRTLKKLKVDGVESETMTSVIERLSSWMWPDDGRQPPPVYNAMSRHAHASLSAESELYAITDTPDRRKLVRVVPTHHLKLQVELACIIFYQMFARLVGFYGWDDAPLTAYGERLSSASASFQLGKE